MTRFFQPGIHTSTIHTIVLRYTTSNIFGMTLSGDFDLKLSNHITTAFQVHCGKKRWEPPPQHFQCIAERKGGNDVPLVNSQTGKKTNLTKKLL